MRPGYAEAICKVTERHPRRTFDLAEADQLVRRGAVLGLQRMTQRRQTQGLQVSTP